MTFLRYSIFTLTITVLLSVAMNGLALAQSSAKGTITGTVIDKDSKETLPSVNVTVKGTYYGGVSSFDGKFNIANMNPGTYNVEFSLIGFKPVLYTGIKVKAGEATSIDVKMEQTVLSQNVVEIIGDKPLFNLEEVQSTHSVNSEDIRLSAVKNVQDVVSMQSGVVQEDNEIHIRGGRSYENAYLVDGVSVQDPLGGMGFGLQLPPGAIQEAEVITGGYNAEYGQATSGIVNITTKEGDVKFSGSVGYKQDHFPAFTKFNTDLIEASLSGPLLTGPTKISFFTTFSGNFTDGYTRWVEEIVNGKPTGEKVIYAPNQLNSQIIDNDAFWAPRRANVWSFLTKLTWRPSSTIKVSYTVTHSLNIDQNSQTVASTLDYVEPNPGFQYDFLYIPDSANTFVQKNFQHAISLTHTLSSKAFYELKLSMYSAHVRGDANGKYYTQYTEPRDLVTLPVQYITPHHIPTPQDTIGVIPGDGFYDIGNPTVWRDHFLTEWTIKGDFTNLFTEKHKFKAGFEHRYQDMQMVDIISPWYKPLGLNNDIYRVNPSQGDLYAQDNITIKGMILNFGLRLDYWFPGKYVSDILSQSSDSINVSPSIQKAYFDETMNLFGNRFKARLSPRLGISHPVSDNQTLFFSYGHFSKLPRPQFIYSKIGSTSAQSSFQTVGNPNLNPETTVSYELGLRNQLAESDVLTVTAYYKDIFDYITARSVKASGSRSGTYTTYINQDYSRVRGLEIEYKTRFSKNLRGTLSGSYSIATGKSSSASEAIYNLTLGLEENIKEVPMIFDRPLQLSANINLSTKKGDPLFGFAPGILEDYNMFVRLFYQSGKRYTYQIKQAFTDLDGRPHYSPDYLNPNGETAESWFYVDLNFEKYFDLNFGTLTVSLEVKNLLDNKNSQIINPVTGRAYEYGDPTQNSVNDPMYPDLTYPVSAYPYNPARYLNPRTVLLGVSFKF